MSGRLEELQDALDVAGLESAGFCFDEGDDEGAIVALDPPVVVWLKPFTVELQADLGAIPGEDVDAEDGPDAPDGTFTSCEDDGRCWLIAEDDRLPGDITQMATRCRALSAIARTLLPAMQDDWEAEPPLSYEERVEHGPLGPGASPQHVVDLDGLEVTDHPMHLTVDPWWGNLELLAFGTVTDGLTGERFVTVDPGGRSAFVLDEHHETITGFVVSHYNEGEPLALDEPCYWDGPRFDVPVLGLVGASAGEVVLAVRARFGDERGSADASHFHDAVGEDDPAEAVDHWRFALEAGDMKAHFGLGYTLCGLGRHREAYDHLRRYTELVPTNGWAWCWYGQACEGSDRLAEARAAYARAVEVDGEETDAPERLAALEG